MPLGVFVLNKISSIFNGGRVLLLSMDIFLRFKSNRHTEAYSQDLVLQLHKRCVMMASLAAIFVLLNVISYAIYPSSGSLSSIMLVMSRVIAGLIVLLGICLMRRKMGRLQRYMFVVNIILDALLIFISFVFYPVLGNLGVDSFSKLGVYVIGWSSCYAVCFVNFMLHHWWMRIGMLFAQMGYFLVFVMQREPLPGPILIIAIEGIVLYVAMNYIHEKYERLDFFEKRKVYDNYEAIKKIFDDISQAILIADNKNQIVYSNQAVHRLFGRSEESCSLLFSDVRVKSMFPQIDTVFTEQVLASRENEGLNVNIPIHLKFLLINYLRIIAAH